MFGFAVSEVVTFEKRWTDFRIFALRCHGNQKYGEFPYGYHLAMVESCLDEAGFSENDYRAAAWLHDVVEDTDTTVEELAYFYGPKIAGLVWACTGVGDNRKQRNAEIAKRLAMFPEAVPVKIADRQANISFALSDKIGKKDNKKLQMYLDEWPEFSATITPLLGESKRNWILWNSLCDTIQRAKDELKR